MEASAAWRFILNKIRPPGQSTGKPIGNGLRYLRVEIMNARRHNVDATSQLCNSPLKDAAAYGKSRHVSIQKVNTERSFLQP